jgi:hypothetical protein
MIGIVCGCLDSDIRAVQTNIVVAGSASSPIQPRGQSMHSHRLPSSVIVYLSCRVCLCALLNLLYHSSACRVISNTNHATLTPDRRTSTSTILPTCDRPSTPVCDTARNDRSSTSLPQVPSPRRVQPTQTPIFASVFRLYRSALLCPRSCWLFLPLRFHFTVSSAFIHIP